MEELAIESLYRRLVGFYSDKRVFITGHTGFKGAWLSLLLHELGAQVMGYALTPPTDPSLFQLAHVEDTVKHVVGDVRSLEPFMAVMEQFQPEIVFHLAAQPIVRASYAQPVYTYETNVMGTVHLLESVRRTDSVRSVVNVTTDKVYNNLERQQGYEETDALCGFDPYSNSKSCSELVSAGYRDAFLRDMGIALSTLRAGNVIGGGDYAKDRILPDCLRAAEAGRPILVRNQNSIRPYQHVLEPLTAYLMVAMGQYDTPALAGCYNVGPEEADVLTTGQLADCFCQTWGQGASWVSQPDGGPHEAGILRLNCGLIKQTFGWQPVWNAETAVKKTVLWARACQDGTSPRAITNQQIREYYGQE